MNEVTLPIDPLWPRAGHWIRPVREAVKAGSPGFGIGLLGVPAFRTSITPTGAHATPAAVREALLRYSTYSWEHGIDVARLSAADFGDVEEPDGREGEARVRAAVRATLPWSPKLLIAVGGDNSITFPVMQGLFGEDLRDCGLVTIDAHHDLRDGETNGSPVRRLLEAGLPGSNVVQVGIADYSNSPEYAERARKHGIRVITRADVERRRLEEIVAEALEIASAGGRHVFVDIDVDAGDRAVVPGCPSAAPGGLSAHQLRTLAYLFASDARVDGMDITEIDATIDTPDQRTVRLAALLVLEAAAGVCARSTVAG